MPKAYLFGECMGATTTQGTGPGMAGRNAKNSVNLGMSSLIGPKVVATGFVTLEGSSVYIQIPGQIGQVSDYCIILTNNSPNHPYISNALSPISGSSEWRFQVTAGTNDVVHYAVLKIGFA